MTPQSPSQCEQSVVEESSKTLWLQFRLVANLAWRAMWSNDQAHRPPRKGSMKEKTQQPNSDAKRGSVQRLVRPLVNWRYWWQTEAGALEFRDFNKVAYLILKLRVFCYECRIFRN